MVFRDFFATELEAALAYDEACVQHNLQKYRNFVVPVMTQSEQVMASLPLIYKNGSIPPGYRVKTTREKLMTSVANAVERDHSTNPRKLSSLECETYTSAAIQAAVERHNQHAGGDPQIFDEYNSIDDEKVMDVERVHNTVDPIFAVDVDLYAHRHRMYLVFICRMCRNRQRHLRSILDRRTEQKKSVSLKSDCE